MTDGIINLLIQTAYQHPWMPHLIIAGATFFQGEIGMLLALTFLLSRAVGLFGFFLSVAIGFFLADLFSYYSGRILREKKIGFWLENHLPYHEQLEKYLQNNLFYPILLAKFLIGINLATMFLSGWSRIDFKKFFKTISFAFILWFIFTAVVGYFLLSGAWALKSAKIIKQLEISFVLIIVVIIAAESFLKKVFFKNQEKWKAKTEIYWKFLEKQKKSR